MVETYIVKNSIEIHVIVVSVTGDLGAVDSPVGIGAKYQNRLGFVRELFQVRKHLLFSHIHRHYILSAQGVLGLDMFEDGVDVGLLGSCFIKSQYLIQCSLKSSSSHHNIWVFYQVHTLMDCYSPI